MHEVRPKKFLGQHFLKDQNIAHKIATALNESSAQETVLEIGPGTGVLTKYLMQERGRKLMLIEIDRESVAYLRANFDQNALQIIEGDFLKLQLADMTSEDLSIIGNFPYNISSQIFFRIIDQRHQVKEVVCMIQKEVADRICAPHGNKTYGILSVLIGAYYHAKLLFKVSPGVFIPPPKVDSAVIRLSRKEELTLGCDEDLFKKIVKQGFQNRRKTLRNALKPILLPVEITMDPIFDKRAEQLSVDDFIHLTKKIELWKK
ncbi:MAG: 16S rRNA (adenine(1518)-N(6)/adenine(1519)-N(6))-dimethyltransferase RsmA [Cyclobacteriaceae bacterium]|nr:16S rRNA (adenine(1518)-N(6)/adenine(1519)-N(6))-dimethyltransferase RsmA [Cyclobacteriaceae bacterium]